MHAVLGGLNGAFRGACAVLFLRGAQGGVFVQRPAARGEHSPYALVEAGRQSHYPLFFQAGRGSKCKSDVGFLNLKTNEGFKEVKTVNFVPGPFENDKDKECYFTS